MNIDIMSTFAQDFDLDQLNNWANFTEDDDGNGTDDLAQSRTHNDANEITDITETTGPAWATPAHDAAGNLTTIPQSRRSGSAWRNAIHSPTLNATSVNESGWAIRPTQAQSAGSSRRSGSA